jgi:hypothetical protein
MSLLKKIFAGTAFAAVFALSSAMSTQAADSAHILTMKPLQALTFDVETKHAVSYFLSDNGTCKLVLTLAEAPNPDRVPHFIATRYEAAIGAGNKTQFNTAEGKSLDFACQAGAQVMSVTGLDQVASSPPGR